MKNLSDPFAMAWAIVRKEILGEIGTDSNPWKIVSKKMKRPPEQSLLRDK